MTKNNIINQPNWLKILAYFFYLLSFLWLKKWLQKKMFEWRKKHKIKKADILAKENGCKYFVVQIERDFIVGTRLELRNYNKKGSKILKRAAKTHIVEFDYRNAIIYETNK